MTIKEKILSFLKENNISQLEFFDKTGISPSNFKGKAKESELGGDKLVKVLATYKNLSPDWLLMDEGEMERIPLCDRLSFVIQVINDVSVAASSLGVSDKELLNLTNNNVKPESPFNFDKFLSQFPEFSRVWLKEGVGTPFRDDNSQNYISIIRDRLFRQRQESFSNEMNDRFGGSTNLDVELEGKVLHQSEDISSLDTDVEKASAMSAPSAGEGIPLIPISAMAGAFSGDQVVLDYECERFVVPTFKGAEFLISVKGSSMYPKYNSGDIVACKRIPLRDIYFQWNKVYVLDTDQGALIKRVKPGSDKDHILIVSDNANYDPFELPLSRIYNVALVIGVIRLE